MVRGIIVKEECRTVKHEANDCFILYVKLVYKIPVLHNIH